MLAFLSVLKILKWNVHWNVLKTLYSPKKQPPRIVRIAVLKNFRKFPWVLFYFLLSKALYHASFPGNSLEFFRTAVLRNKSGWLLLRLSGETAVQMQSPGNIRIAVQKKFEKTPRKNLCWCAFYNFNYQNTLWWIVSR